MKKSSFILLSLSGLLFTTSCETKDNKNKMTSEETTQKEQPKGLSNEDKKFIMNTANDGMLEVELGKLAHTKASSKEVKDFGHHIMMDHEKANKQLKNLASSKNIILSDSLDKDAKDKKEEFAKLSGKEFDKKYVKDMVEDHKKDVEKFEDIAKNSEDLELKSWAQETLPTLRNHYAEAQRLDSMMSTSSKKKSNNKTSMK